MPSSPFTEASFCALLGSHCLLSTINSLDNGDGQLLWIHSPPPAPLPVEDNSPLTPQLPNDASEERVS